MINDALITEMQKIIEPGPLLAELGKRFPGRTAVAISGQLSDSALIDMAVKANARVRFYTVDTLRVFPETLVLFSALEKRYSIQIERLKPSPADLEPMIREHGEYLFFDSKEKQELCCRIRKVLPNERVLESLDVWVTGLRSDQSQARAGVKRLEIIKREGPQGKRALLKVSPLADWKEEKVRQYLKTNQVPVHKLLEAKLPGGFYYESLGCIICTTPIGPDEPRRAGRWRWFNSQDDKKECGLHLPQNSPDSESPS